MRAVVTGAASGIGRAVAEQLLAEGATVVAVDRDAGRLDELASQGAETCAADLATSAGRAAAIEAAGELTHLVNAAGILRMEPIDDVDEAAWRQVFAINAEAVFFLLQAL